jgi:hypothetical protein
MRTAEQIVGDLVEALEPVRFIPRLRTVAAVALVLGAASSAVVFGFRGLRADLAEAVVSPSLVLVAIGLTGIALGGIAASLGAGVPGREAVLRSGLWVLLCGFVLAAGAAGWCFVSVGAAAWEGMGIRCLSTAFFAGLLPGLGLLAFLGFAFPTRPLVAAAAASGGAVGLGAISVHGSCPATGGLHVLVGHALAPLLGGVVLALVLYSVLCRLRGEARDSA